MAKQKKEKFSNRALTERLRELMAEVHDSHLGDEGELTMVTKGERLAEILVERALGWDEVTIEETDIPGAIREKTVKHKPERWAIEMCYDRLEGKTPQALTDETVGLSATDKISELAKRKINTLTEEETKNGDV